MGKTIKAIKGNKLQKVRQFANKAKDENRTEFPKPKTEKNTFEQTMTLYTLQDKIKRQPDLYRKEFGVHLAIFQEKLVEFKENPAKKDEKMNDYFKFMAHISGVYKTELAEYLSQEIMNLLQQYYSIMNPVIRMTLVTSLKIMRGKDVVGPSLVLPVLLKLFRCEDKGLRKFIHSIVVSDLKRLNQNHKVQNINKKLQTFIFQMIQDPNESASRRSLNVMVELYKRKIWNDEKTVNVISEACFNENPKIVVAACKFFLILDYDFESDNEESSGDEEDISKKIELLKQRKGSKMTANRQQKLDRAVKQVKRKNARKGLVHFSTDFLPIDTIYDPQAFVEKLFSKLKKSNDKYEVKLYMLRLISRMIGRHKIQLLQFYPNLLRYLNSHNKDKVSEIFAMVIESCHDLVPPETIRPIIERIISNYASEYCNNQHITIGLNAIREILMRMPLALEEDQIEYLCNFRTIKVKAVSAAAKSLINYFRDVCPELLPKKMRGRFSEVDFENKKDAHIFGAQPLNFDIDGIELLKKAEKIGKDVNLAADGILDDRALKKIKILQLKDGVRKVDRHGFREADELKDKVEDEQEANALKDEYMYKLLELKKLQRLKQMHEDGEMEDYGEEGEDEMMEGEEGEDEMEEEKEDDGDDEFVSDDENGDEEIPNAIPADKYAVCHTKEPESNSEVSEVSDIDVDDYDDESEDYDSDELDLGTTENPHGFVYANMLETFGKSRKDRIEEMREQNDPDKRNKHKKKQTSKKIGKSERVHQKNKPFMMVKKKKIDSIRESQVTINAHKDRTKKFLGHWSKAKCQRIDSKKVKSKGGKIR